MRICLDTMILIDILKDEHRFVQELFYEALADRETLIVPVVVFSELMPQFGGDIGQVRMFLNDHQIRIENLDQESAATAGSRWLRYLARKEKAKCPRCGFALDGKEHFLADFYIGGFALTRCDTILTRDRGIYKKYFSELKGYGGCLGGEGSGPQPRLPA